MPELFSVPASVAEVSATQVVLLDYWVHDGEMCMRSSAVRPYQKWNWAGDNIVQRPVVPAARSIPGSRRARYDIDLRQFLSTANNEVVSRELDDLRSALDTHVRAAFGSKNQGAFDLRVRLIQEHMRRLAHKKGRSRKTRPEAWLFPEETLANGGGDCEDLAFLLCALLLASGVSGYTLRVALGSIVCTTEEGTESRWDHAWVVYKTEGGAWEILEPLGMVHGARRRAGKQAGERLLESADIEYIPHLVFNRDHVWTVRSHEKYADESLTDYLADRQFWEGFDPAFALGVHNSIFDDALRGMSAPDLRTVKLASLEVDANTLRYDPRDHFDFSYVREGWQRVNRRLRSRGVREFGLAAHAIADFYAHTLYGEFAKTRRDGSLKPYGSAEDMTLPARYDFSAYDLPGCSRSRRQAEDHWSGKLLSGQWWRWYTTFPDELEVATDFRFRRCLPDHDAIAVDEPLRKASHRRYDWATYQTQFALRRAAAVEHIRTAYRAWRR